MTDTLPGDPTPTMRLQRMIRMDHAGEAAALHVIEGQLALLGRSRHGDTLRTALAQGQTHAAAFAAMVAEHRVRPTALLPLWYGAGYALGAITAALGERGATACTVAVEEAMDEHYAQQANSLDDDETGLRATIERFRAEAVGPPGRGTGDEAAQTPAYALLSRVIKFGCKLAIGASERV